MKFMSTWSAHHGRVPDAVDRFLKGRGEPPKGVKLLGRWHFVDGSGGCALIESDSPEAMYEYSAMWTDLMDIRTVAVVEDAEAGAGLARVYKK